MNGRRLGSIAELHRKAAEGTAQPLDHAGAKTPEQMPEVTVTCEVVTQLLPDDFAVVEAVAASHDMTVEEWAGIVLAANARAEAEMIARRTTIKQDRRAA